MEKNKNMRKRDILKKFEFFVKIILYLSKIFPKNYHKAVLKKTRNWDSYVGLLVRYISLKNLCKSCGHNVAIFSGVYIINPENLEIGDNVSIHPMCYIDSTGTIKIGNDVSIAHSSTVMSTEHNYNDLNINIKDQGLRMIPTIIEDNVWIGSGSRILAGARIGKGSIIASGAVVKNRVNEFTIVGGVPAKLIKERK